VATAEDPCASTSAWPASSAGWHARRRSRLASDPFVVSPLPRRSPRTQPYAASSASSRRRLASPQTRRAASSVNHSRSSRWPRVGHRRSHLPPAPEPAPGPATRRSDRKTALSHRASPCILLVVDYCVRCAVRNNERACFRIRLTRLRPERDEVLVLARSTRSRSLASRSASWRHC
jgi:hypothetical protein